jgi:hypothetical protein
MTFKLKTLTTSALLSALALTGPTASAHPSFVNGGNPNGINWKNNTPTFSSSCKQDPITLRWNCEDMVMGTVRGYMEDSIRIAHGCDIQDTGSNVDPVVANSWLWPTGKGGAGNWSKAPMSTGCSATGNNCTGSATQACRGQNPGFQPETQSQWCPESRRHGYRHDPGIRTGRGHHDWRTR